ncbi:MAG: glycoside hydrolase family 95 protein [Candidatus Nealsonbacteria bacterium]|nr:glycoside hydrolase family 95 protein [Candidatus Nealsonbacteria bacterium]
MLAKHDLLHVVRLGAVLAVVLPALVGQVATAGETAENAVHETTDRALTLWYTQPASAWTEALPIGNGRLGAMVFGSVERERLQLNEDTLWSGGPHCYDNPDAYRHLAEVREAVEQGKFVAAEATAQEMLGRPKYQHAYLPLGDLFLDFPKSEKPSEYRRELNMRGAVAQVTYRIGDARFTRKVFASRPDEAIVMRLECDKPGRITFDLSMKSPHPSKSQAIANDTLSMAGHVEPREESRLIAPWPREGLGFEARVRIAAEGGKVAARGDKISVNGADAATLFYVAATSYVNCRDVVGDPAVKLAKCVVGIKRKSFEQLYTNHLDDHAELFGRVSIELGGKGAATMPTDERLKRAARGTADPLLAEQLFQYGRYLMIAGSRPGTQPLNLQGIWNDQIRPPWGSKYTININIQMNYWVAEVCNLSECHEPLLRMIGELQRPGASTAKVHYKAGGWVAHHNTDLWRGTAPVDGAQWGMWQTGGAWLCQHLWEHYLYSGDTEHLKQSYPILKGAAQFFLDFLVENKHGHLITSPSLSPEHSHGGGLSAGRAGPTICSGPTIDMQILRDLFGNCIEASKILDIDEEFRARLTRTRARLAPMKIGRHGQLQEWQEDWDNPEDKHGHVSHLYGLYPSCQINRRDTPKLFAAARTSLMHRGPHGGWPGAWSMSLWARLGEGDRAHDILVNHVMPILNENLFNSRQVYQIDANFGATAGIAEMLLQSHGGEIHLLPALPKSWATGSVTGLRARGGFEIDMVWKDGQLTQSTIRSHLGRSCRIRTHSPVRVVSGGKDITSSGPEPSVVEFETRRGESYRLLPGVALRR